MHRQYYSHPHDDPIPEFIQAQVGEDENFIPGFCQQPMNRRQTVGPPSARGMGDVGCGRPPSARDRDVADALARRVLEERDEAIRRAEAAEAAYKEAMIRHEQALEERNEAGVAAARAENVAREAILQRDECEDEVRQDEQV